MKITRKPDRQEMLTKILQELEALKKLHNSQEGGDIGIKIYYHTPTDYTIKIIQDNKCVKAYRKREQRQSWDNHIKS